MDGFGVDPIPGLEPLVPETVGMGTVRLRVRNGPAAGSEFELYGLRTRLGRNDPPASVVDIDLTSLNLARLPKYRAAMRRSSGWTEP